MFFYNMLLYLLTPALILFFAFKRRSLENVISISWRTGRYPKDFIPSSHSNLRIWFHAASVGEVNALVSLLNQMREHFPDAWIGLSTMTQSGLEMARVNLPNLDQHFLCPYDHPSAAKRAMRTIKPDLFITIETEIWPNLIRYAKHYQACVLMINGRISIRSIKGYQKFKRFFKQILSHYDAIGAIGQDDAQRLVLLGADPAKVRTLGNIKYDRLAEGVNPQHRQEMAAILNLTGEEDLFVAGSTREGEEEQILEAFTIIKKAHPKLMLLIAPRHVNRGEEIREIVIKYGFTPVLRTELTKENHITTDTVIILNTIGELFKVYSLASITFCGASLVPLGGQNPLEPAAWGKVVLYGPSMEDFLDAKGFLEETGSGIEVDSPATLANKTIDLLNNTSRLIELGEKGKKMILLQQGSSLRSLELIKETLSKQQNTKQLM